MDIQLVLQLSAVATVISAGISYITFRKSSNLTYITQERKEWREAIRRIAEELERCPYEKRKHVLVQLKTRINAYGLDTEDVLEDAHIWKQIRKIETCDQAEYDELKDQLIIYLSLLLKYDWERSKKEVYGNPLQLVGYVMSAITLLLFTMGLIEMAGDKVMTEVPVIIQILLLCVCSIVLIAYMTKVERKSGKARVILYPLLLIGILIGLAVICAQNPALSNSYTESAIIAGVFATGIQLLIEVVEIFDCKMYQCCVSKCHGTAKKNDD